MTRPAVAPSDSYTRPAFPGRLGASLAENAGHSLIEALIALAILLGVLAPTGSALAVLLAHQSAGDRVSALAHAEHALEYTLVHEAFSDSTAIAGQPALEIRRTVVREGELATIVITAGRPRARHPFVMLHATVFAREP
jgi:Tfp pilus assembly protein PilV